MPRTKSVWNGWGIADLKAYLDSMGITKPDVELEEIRNGRKLRNGEITNKWRLWRERIWGDKNDDDCEVEEKQEGVRCGKKVDTSSIKVPMKSTIIRKNPPSSRNYFLTPSTKPYQKRKANKMQELLEEQAILVQRGKALQQKIQSQVSKDEMLPYEDEDEDEDQDEEGYIKDDGDDGDEDGGEYSYDNVDQ